MVIAIRNTERLLEGFVASRQRAAVPVPLKAVSYEVRIVSGLAVVKQRRVFRNDEEQPIEATLTFPVAYDSVVSDVRATVAGRTLLGIAKEKKEARATYEKALDDGKATVLHEELMRGLHMVSAGNIAPGAEIVVEATSVAPLSIVSNIGKLRIPLTIGAIYGTSPLIPSDDIVTDGVGLDAEVVINGADGVQINGQEASAVTTVKTSAVIDITVPTLSLYPLQAKMPSGSWASVSFSVPPGTVYPVDADLLLDTSGSMAENAHRGATKWTKTINGLSDALSRCAEGDRFRFWTFSDQCALRCEAVGQAAVPAIKKVPFDNGGTRLAEAVHKVAGSRAEANILLVTDGKSHTEIDYERIRRSGARFTVVLVGRGAFETRVAQLASLTGGQMFVVDADIDVASVVAAALNSMRSSATPIKPSDDPEANVERKIGGLCISVAYQSDCIEGVKDETAVVALAAGLAVSALPAATAGTLAEKAGIVSHLTSIVMVDADGPEVDGIAVNRKVALAQSDETLGFMSLEALGGGSDSAGLASFAAASYSCAAPMGSGGGNTMRLLGSKIGGVMRGFIEPQSADFKVAGLPPIPGNTRSRTTITTVIETESGFHIPVSRGFPSGFDDISKAAYDWRVVAEVINGGSASQLGRYELGYAQRIAGLPEVIALAGAINVPVLHIALALIAKAIAHADRQAQRIARKILDQADAAAVDLAVKLVA